MAAHLYWKLLVNSANSGQGTASFSLAEWAFYDASNTQISTSGATATGSPAFSGTPANVIDGNSSTFYCANGFTFPQYVQVQFPSAVAVDHFTLTNTLSAGEGPTDFALQYSDNGTTWTTAFSYQNAMWTNAQVTQTFYTTGIVYRLKVTSSGSTSGDPTVAIGDLSFYDASSTLISTATGTPLASGQSRPNVVANAFDGSGCSTFWDSALAFGAPSSGSPQWIGFHFPSSVSVASVTLTTSSNSFFAQHGPLVFDLQFSSDGATFVSLGSYTASWTGTCQTQTFSTTTATISLSPSVGVQGNAYTVTVTGSNTHFVAGTTTVAISGTGATVSSVSVVSSTSLTFSLALSGTATLGARTVTVTTGPEAPTVGFTVLSAGVSPSAVVRDNIAWSQFRLGNDGRAGLGSYGQSTDNSGAADYLATWDAAGTLIKSTVTAGTAGSAFSNPMTTPGDLIKGGSAGAAQRLAIGSTGQVLTVVSGAPAWAAASSGGSSGGPGMAGALTVSPPDPATFTLSGSNPAGTTTNYVSGSNFSIVLPAGSVNSAKYYKTLPSSPWTIYCAVSVGGDATQSNDFNLGLYDSSQARVRGLRLTMITGGAWRWGLSSASGDLTTQTGMGQWYQAIPYFMRIKNDGTNVTYSWSFDGGNSWYKWYSEAISNISSAVSYGFNSGNVSSTQTFGATIWTLYTTP